ncbi:Nitrite reductase small subunit NirD [Sulfidibacter corallicola]|nr:nitrite reductase small subunit NirD [Sulfidibacter corallicola]
MSAFMSSAPRWQVVGHIDQIPLRGARVVQTPLGNIALFRAAVDRVYALEDRCPHRGGPLSEGLVHNGRVTCPLHQYVIELDTGEAVYPDEGCVTTYPVRLEEGRIEIDLTGSRQTEPSPSGCAV